MSVEPATKARRRAPTPADVAVLLVLAAAVPGTRHLSEPASASVPRAATVRTADGSESTYDLAGARDVDINGPLGTTRLRIRDGSAWIFESPCRRHLCIKMGELRPGRSLVCIPNRVVVRVVGGEADVDAVTR